MLVARRRERAYLLGNVVVEDSVDAGIVFVAAIAAASLIVLMVWIGLHTNRAEAKAGHTPGWVIWTALALATSLVGIFWLRNASPLMEAFSSALVGTWLGGCVTFLLLRWFSRLGAR